MTFIVQPTKEGETKECPTCNVSLIARLTDYKGRFPDKLQWQQSSERKAHYDKDGNCNSTTPVPESKPETVTKPTLFDGPDKEKIAKKAILLWNIRCEVELAVKTVEVNPNGGMVWEMTKIIYDEFYRSKN